MMRYICLRILCFLQIHLKAIKKKDGLHCTICGAFKDRCEHQADLHAGGGW